LPGLGEESECGNGGAITPLFVNRQAY